MRVMVTERPVVPARFHAGVVDACAWGSNVADRSAEHAHAADRFAREILAILTVSAVRSRRLMGMPFGRWSAWSALLLFVSRASLA